MSELNAYKGDVTIPVYGTIADAEVYLKKDVDKVIAKLKMKLEDAKATAYTESMDAGMRKRRLNRALWLAKEWRAWCEGQFWLVLESNKPRDIYHLILTNRIHRTPNEWMTYWYKVEQLCKKKAETYK